MDRCRSLLARALREPASLRFVEVCRLAECHGFERVRAAFCRRTDMSDPTYSTVVHWSPEDACFVARCPELGNLSAFGDTPAEAAGELQTAIHLSLEQHCADGKTPPAPAHLPTFSGQFRLRLPRSLHARLAADAEREGVSLNTYVVCRLSEATTGEHG